MKKRVTDGLRRVVRWGWTTGDEPIASSRWFVGSYAVYNALLFGSIIIVTPGTAPTLERLGGVAVIMGLIALGNARVLIDSGNELSNDRIDGRIDVPLVYFTPVLAFAAYVGYYLLTVANATISPLVAVAVTQASLSAVVVGVYSRPLIPQRLPDVENKVDYLELHLSLWWRAAQITVTFLFAIGVGLAASSYSSWRRSADVTEQEVASQLLPAGLGLLVLVAFVGVLALGYYALLKFYTVGQEVREHYDTSIEK